MKKSTIVTILCLVAVSALAQSTNAVPAGILDQVPGLNLLPQKLQGIVLAALVAFPLLGRAIHALQAGGGLRGIWNAVVFGTNTPKPTNLEPPKE